MARGDWYWLNDDHSVGKSVSINDREEFTKYSEWLYGKNGDWLNKWVAQTKVGEILVSTVFLGLDHSFDSNGPPILFETMVMGGPNDQHMERYMTWDEAVVGHERIVKEQPSGLTRDQLEASRQELDKLLFPGDDEIHSLSHR